MQALCAPCVPQTRVGCSYHAPYSSTVVSYINLPHAPTLLAAASVLSLYISCKYTRSVREAVDLVIRRSSREASPAAMEPAGNEGNKRG